MRAPSAAEDPDAVEDPPPDAPDHVDGAPAPDTHAPPPQDTLGAEGLLEPADEADDLHLIVLDGPNIHGRHKHGKRVYSFTFAHPTPASIARGLCSPSDITKAETMERVKKAYSACGIDLREAAVFREPHLTGLPHDAVLCRSQVEHKWLPICHYMYVTWKMRMGASKHITTWSDGCKYVQAQRSKDFHFSKSK